MSDYNRGLSREDIERIGKKAVGKTFKENIKTIRLMENCINLIKAH